MTTAPSIIWYGHDSFRINGSQTVVYVDPWKLPPNAPPADIILITHDHQDHCSPVDVAAISRPDTELVMPAACATLLPSAHQHLVVPGQTLTLRDINITTVPAYNTNKTFHPRERHMVGYIISVDGQRIYHAGDTDRIPEMREFSVDTALLPVSGTYVMTAEEAAEAAIDLHPQIVIPMHYGRMIGTMDDVERFQKLVPSDITVNVLPQSE